MEGWMDGEYSGMSDCVERKKERKKESTGLPSVPHTHLFPPLHFLPAALQLSPLSALQFRLSSNYRSFLSTPSLCCLLGADVSAEGPFIREEERSVGERAVCVCV